MRRETINNARGAMYVKIGCNGRTFIGVAQTASQAWDDALSTIRQEAQDRVNERKTLTLSQA